MLASRDITYIIKGIPTRLNTSWAPSVMRVFFAQQNGPKAANFSNP
jgi:hypothetical protein